jgi:hypothetical protein
MRQQLEQIQKKLGISTMEPPAAAEVQKTLPASGGSNGTSFVTPQDRHRLA